jgi:hypothetical protein
MKKFRRIITLLIMTLLLTNCGKEKLSLDEEVTLTGRITHQQITENDSMKMISVLTLEEPVVIDGEIVRKIELEYDKDLKTDTDITITGTIKDNGNSTYEYLFSASSINDILSYVNTFSNEDFSITIPVELMKELFVEKIDNGYKVSIEHKEKKYEVFRAISVTKEEYNNIKNDSSIEVAKSNDTKKIIIVYSDDDIPEEKIDIAEDIYKSMSKITGNIRIK